MYKGHLRSSKQVATNRTLIVRWITSAQKLWCFKTPRDISTVLLLLGISMSMMCSNSLALVIIAHIGTGITYVCSVNSRLHHSIVSLSKHNRTQVLLSQSSATGLLVYCQDTNLGSQHDAHRLLNSCQMSSTMLVKILAAMGVPLLSEISMSLPFLISAGLSFFGAVLLGFIFMNRISQRFHSKGESYMLLSKSIYKLEAEVWDEEENIRRLKTQSCLSNSSREAENEFDSTNSCGERVTKSMMVDVLEPIVDEIVDREVDVQFELTHRNNSSSNGV